MNELIQKIKKLNCPISVGLDSALNLIPEEIKQKSLKKFQNPFEAASNAMFEFNEQIIEAVHDIIPAIKIQSAFYEQFGHFGMEALEKTIQLAKSKSLYIILDVKRNDIGNSMQAYSSAYLGECNLIASEQKSLLNVDAITVNGFLGTDSILPLIKDCIKFNKDIFILVKTSNESSVEFQNAKLSTGEFLFERIANMVKELGSNHIEKNGFSPIGAVVGATFPDEMKILRTKLNSTFFLVPGFGAQGAAIKTIANAFINKSGAIINSSRSILGAWQKNKQNSISFAKAARDEVLKMKDLILSEIEVQHEWFCVASVSNVFVFI